jgi:hypothetical protein
MHNWNKTGMQPIDTKPLNSSYPPLPIGMSVWDMLLETTSTVCPSRSFITARLPQAESCKGETIVAPSSNNSGMSESIESTQNPILVPVVGDPPLTNG